MSAESVLPALSILDHARELHARGLAVIPIPRPGAGRDGKTPAISWKQYQQRRPTEGDLAAWFSGPAPLNLATVTGAVSGVVVVDCDDRAAEAWAAANLPETPWQVRTARGRHLYYRHPGGVVGNKARCAPNGLKLDLRGDGGYVITAPSVHSTGVVYTAEGDWSKPVTSLPALPLKMFSAAPTRPAPALPRADPPRPLDLGDSIAHRVRAYLATVEPAVQGQGGDQATYRVACVLRRDFSLSEGEALGYFEEWNRGCVPPWSEAELLTKLRNAGQYGKHAEGTLRDVQRPEALPLRLAARTLPAERTAAAVECPGCGRETCPGDCAPAEVRPAAIVAGPVFRTAADVMRAAPRREIVAGTLTEDAVAVLVSESGTGKTFVCLDLAAHIARGERWFGRDTDRGSVAYVSFEGDAFGLRLQALADKHGDLENLYLLQATEPISPRVARDGIEDVSRGEALLVEQLRALAARIAAAERPPIKLVVVDTVRASMTGSEDSSESVSAYLRAVRRVAAAAPGAACLLVHHAGWQDGETKKPRERGSSAFRGNADATLYLELERFDQETGEATLILRTVKVRDGQRPAPVRMIRKRVDVLALDHRGQPLSSCIVVPDTTSPADREAEQAEQLAAASRALDLVILRTIRDFPEATSIDGLRKYAQRSKPDTGAAVNRLLAARLIVDGKRGKPYSLTAAGIEAAK